MPAARALRHVSTASTATVASKAGLIIVLIVSSRRLGRRRMSMAIDVPGRGVKPKGILFNDFSVGPLATSRTAVDMKCSGMYIDRPMQALFNGPDLSVARDLSTVAFASPFSTEAETAQRRL